MKMKIDNIFQQIFESIETVHFIVRFVIITTYRIIRKLLLRILACCVVFGSLMLLLIFVITSDVNPLGEDFMDRLNESVKHYEPDCRSINQQGPHPETSGDSPPFQLGNQTRYIGEDAKFVCSSRIIGYNTSMPHINQIAWKKDGEYYVKPDNRHFISWTFEKDRKSETYDLLFWFIITTTLQIDLIEQNDFGVYNCYISARTHYIPLQAEFASKPKASKRNKQKKCNRKCTCRCDHSVTKVHGADIELLFLAINDFVWSGEFRLLEELPRTKKIFIAPGSLISFATYYRHLGDKADITIYYTLNGREVHNHQSRCSWFVLAYYVLSKGNFISLGNVTMLEMSLNEWKAAVSVMWQCIDPNSYGIHDIVILRRVFNNNNGKEYILEIKHPLKLDIKPKESTLFTDSKTKNKEAWSSIFNINCWSTDITSRPAICSTIDLLVQTISDNVHKDEMCLCLKFSLLSLLSLFVCYFLKLMYVKVWLMIDSFRYLPRKVPSVECFANLQKHEDADMCNHIYLSYIEEDASFVRKNILPVLKKFELKIFDRKLDVELGSFKNIEIAKAINQSLAFIVIASSGYVKDRERNTFELSNILHNSSTTNLLILTRDNCCINEVFKKQYTVIDWSKEKPDKIRVQKWIHTNFLLQTFRFYLLQFIFG